MKTQAAQPIALASLRSKQKKWNLRPEYQRNEVWKRPQKQLLIDSILRGIHIPELILRKSKEKKIEFEVTDGQQRLRAVFEFMNDYLKVGKNTVVNDVNLSGLTYSKLPEEFKEKFDDYAFNFIAIDGTDEEVEDMFRRLQNSTSLKPAEFRNSISGKVRGTVHDLIKHDFMVKTCGITDLTNNRLQFNEVVEQIITLEINGITDLKRGDIDKLYEKYNEEGIPEEEIDKVERVFDYLYKAFGDKDQGTFKKATIVSLYVVMSEYLQHDEECDNAQKFADWFIDFENQRIFQKTLSIEEQEDIYQRYNSAIGGGSASKESIQTRKDILMTSWLNSLKED